MVVCSEYFFLNEHRHEMYAVFSKNFSYTHSLNASLPVVGSNPNGQKEWQKERLMPLLWIEHSTSRNRMGNTGDLK
jgi:hypothetical protein